MLGERCQLGGPGSGIFNLAVGFAGVLTPAREESGLWHRRRRHCGLL